jgi:uncharacterized membrane protein
MRVLPDGPTSRGAATSWRVYLFLLELLPGTSRWSDGKVFFLALTAHSASLLEAKAAIDGE